MMSTETREYFFFRIRLTRSERRRLDAVCGRGQDDKRETFIRRAVLAGVIRKERAKERREAAKAPTETRL